MAARRAEQTLFVSPSLLLPEIGGTISRRTGDPDLAQRAIEGIALLPGLRLVGMNRSLAEEAAALASQLRLRGGDALYVATAAALHLPLCTHNEEQSRVAAYSIEIIRL